MRVNLLQSNSVQFAASTVARSITLSAPSTAGSLVLVVLSTSTAPASLTVTDNLGNTYTLTSSFGSGPRFWLYVRNEVAAGLTTISALPGGLTAISMAVLEYTGPFVSGSTVFAAQTFSQGATADYTSSAVTNPSAPNLFVALAATSIGFTGTPSVDPPLQVRVSAVVPGTNGLIVADDMNANAAAETFKLHLPSSATVAGFLGRFTLLPYPVVQSSFASGSGSGAITASFNRRVATHNGIVVVVSENATSGQVSSLTDNFSNTYLIAAASSDGARRVSIWYAANVTGGSGLTVTTHVTGTVSNTAMTISEVENFIGLDQVNTNSGGATTTPSTNPITTQVGNEVVFIALRDSVVQGATVPTGFFNLFNGSAQATEIGYEGLVSLQVNLNPNWVLAAAASFVSAIASFIIQSPTSPIIEINGGPMMRGAPWVIRVHPAEQPSLNYATPPTPYYQQEIRVGPPMRGSPLVAILPAELALYTNAPPPVLVTQPPVLLEPSYGPPLRGAPWIQRLPIEVCMAFAVQTPARLVSFVSAPESPPMLPMLGAPWVTRLPAGPVFAGRPFVAPSSPAQDYIAEVQTGPPLRGAPWLQRLPAQPVIVIKAPPTIPAGVTTFIPETRQGPTMRGAPWVQRLHAETSTKNAPPVIPVQPAGRSTPVQEVAGGPAMRGVPWLSRLPAEPVVVIKPPVVVTPRGVPQLPLIVRDPVADPRLRRFTERLSEIVNSLVGQGILYQTEIGEWSLNLAALPANAGTSVSSTGGIGTRVWTFDQIVAALKTLNLIQS